MCESVFVCVCVCVYVCVCLPVLKPITEQLYSLLNGEVSDVALLSEQVESILPYYILHITSTIDDGYIGWRRAERK